MNKNELMNDMIFRKVCTNYGLDWENFNVYQDIIILNTPRRDIYVLLDDHYNTIGIPKKEYFSPERKIEEYALGYKDLYENVCEEEGFSFPYPFQNYSLKQMVELANRIEIDETNHGHSYDMIVNGELVSGEGDEAYISLLSYIRFLGDQIKKYFMNLYQMRMMGFDYPSVYQYLSSIMNNINRCIDDNIKKGNRPFPNDIINYLGQASESKGEYDLELYSVIKLLLKQKGVKIKHYKELEMMEKDPTDLSNISNKLLKILEVSMEEVISRYQARKKTLEINNIDLESWLNEGYTLTK